MKITTQLRIFLLFLNKLRDFNIKSKKKHYLCFVSFKPKINKLTGIWSLSTLGVSIIYNK